MSRLTWDVRDPTAPAEYNDDTETALGHGEARDAVFRPWGRTRAGIVLLGARNMFRPSFAIKGRADALGGIHAHLSTTQAGRGGVEGMGKDAGARYAELGVLGPNAISSIWARLRTRCEAPEGRDASVCHCPSASMFGGFGCIAHGRFPELVETGVRVALGTDACAVSRFLDMVRVMYLAACAHKDAKVDPTVIGAHKAMEMATVDAAETLLWADDIGSLEPGKLADIVIADTGGIAWQPNPFVYPVANLIYSASGDCVETVIIDGRIVLKDRRFTMIDKPDFVARAGTHARTIFARLGFEPRTVWPVQ